MTESQSVPPIQLNKLRLYNISLKLFNLGLLELLDEWN
jgi:hypothetical protein